jgi:DNA gyrase/topoisomerase IV subunit A
LVTHYLNLREADAEIALMGQTITGFERADVFQAQSQLATTCSELEGLIRNRRTYENAIAVLIGEPASSFSLPSSPWSPTVHSVPTELRSEILQRRHDIASAERAVAAADATIGIETPPSFHRHALGRRRRAAERDRQALRILRHALVARRVAGADAIRRRRAPHPRGAGARRL